MKVMKNLIAIIAIFTTSCQVFSQTKSIELQNMSRRYQDGEFTVDTYKQYAQVWQDLLEDLGGYPSLPYDTASETMKFESVTELGVTKEIIFERILEWAAINFNHLDAVLHYKSLQSGKIILKGYFDVTHRRDLQNFWGNSKENFTQTTCYQTYVFTIKNGRLKTQISNIRYEFNSFGESFEVSIDNMYPITNFGSNQWKEKLDLLNQTNLKITRLSENLIAYIESYNNDYDF